MNSFTLTAIPLFILMAEIMQHSGLSLRVYRGLSKLVCVHARRPAADQYRRMRDVRCHQRVERGDRGLDRHASRCRSSCSAELRPPAFGGLAGRRRNARHPDPASIAMIVYGTFTETSVAKLFMAGVMPGLLLTAMFMAYIAVHALLEPSSRAARNQGREIRRGIARRACGHVCPSSLLIGGTMGSIYLGLVTPTEAAAVGCVLAMIIRLIWGEFNWADSVQAAADGQSGSAATSFHRLCGLHVLLCHQHAGVGEQITKFLVGLKLSRLEFFLALFVLYTVLGCLVESLGMIVITVPLLYPVLLQYGIDPIWFGVILVMFIEMGQISPPIGINLFVIQSIWDGKLGDVVMGTIPFHLIMFVLLGILMVWPEIALWLPHHLAVKPAP